MLRSVAVSGASLFALALVGCGGSTATLKLMDAPTDDLSKLEITVASMQVHVVPASDKTTEGRPDDASIDDDDGWVSLEVNRKLDLMAHVGEGAAATLGDLSLPEGKITQVRLVIDTALPENNVATRKDASTCQLDVTKVAKKGVKINHVFKAFESKDGAAHEVLVDFELDKSLSEAGDCYLLEPKLKLFKVKTDGEEQPLI